MCRHKFNVDAISSSAKLVFEVDKKWNFLLRCVVMEGSMILTKEYSGTIPELLWGEDDLI
jgi:hypothetical protein